MQSIDDLINGSHNQPSDKQSINHKLTPEERFKRKQKEQKKADWFNKQEGDLFKLTGYDCRLCKNKGGMFIVRYVEAYDDYVQFWRDCECMKKRSSMQKARESGLDKMQETYTFDSYKTDRTCQKIAKEKAKKYAGEKEAWFYIGGQSGSGKTHLCTAISNEILKQGNALRYFLWRDDGTRLKRYLVSGDSRYDEEIDQYKKIDVLFIDDLFKVGKGKNGELSISSGDVNLAFEILNYRYNNKLKTIISSELSDREIEEVDEALAGRINEMTDYGEYILIVNKSEENNHRI